MSKLFEVVWENDDGIYNIIGENIVSPVFEVGMRTTPLSFDTVAWFTDAEDAELFAKIKNEQYQE